MTFKVIAGCASGQDETIPVFCLAAERARWSYLVHLFAFVVVVAGASVVVVVFMDSYSITVHEILNRRNLVSRSQVMWGETGAHLKTPTDENYLAVCSPMLTACQDLLY